MERTIPNTEVIIDDQSETFKERKLSKANIILIGNRLNVIIPKPVKKDVSKNPPIHNEGISIARVLKNNDVNLTLRFHHDDKISDQQLDLIKIDLVSAATAVRDYLNAVEH